VEVVEVEVATAVRSNFRPTLPAEDNRRINDERIMALMVERRLLQHRAHFTLSLLISVGPVNPVLYTLFAVQGS
jgi:hypothetical protein